MLHCSPAYILYSPGSKGGSRNHFEFPGNFVFEMMLWTLNIHFNFVSFQNFAWVCQEPRWRTAAILKSEVWLFQRSFGVYQCVIYVEILKLGPGIHSSIDWSPKSLFSHVSTPWALSSTNLYSWVGKPKHYAQHKQFLAFCMVIGMGMRFPKTCFTEMHLPPGGRTAQSKIPPKAL